MPMRRIKMEKVREIIRLREQCQLSNRAIARALRISRPVVGHYLDRLSQAGLDYAAVSKLSDDALLDVLDGPKPATNERYQTLRKQFSAIAKELRRPGVTLERLWHEYLEHHPDGYSYSQFCYHFQVWRSTSELTMHIEHKAGDKLFVDFTGTKLHLVDRKTGEQKDVEVFVAVLGASRLTYVEAVASQKKHDWIRVNENALHFLGGVPRAIVPDCLKTAVTRPDRYEPQLNPEYQDFARHYKTTILPARPGRPKDKAMVEGAVRIVYAWIFAAIRNRIFHTLGELNAAIREQLDHYNRKPMQKLNISRQTLFEQTEKDTLAPLPSARYVLRTFRQVKAQFNYHVYLSEDQHYYSIPYRYRGRRIEMIYTDSTVEVFCNNQRIALHQRDRTPNGYTTVKEHMPSHHQVASEWNPQRLINWARDLGEAVRVVIERVLAQQQHPEQSYKTCLGILGLAKRFGARRLDKACRKAMAYEYCSYTGIKNILDNGLEDAQLDCFAALPAHENIRGKAYYNRERRS